MSSFLEKNGRALVTTLVSLWGGYFIPGIALFANQFELVLSWPALLMSVSCVVGVLISAILWKILGERRYSMIEYLILGFMAGALGFALAVLAVLINPTSG